MGRREGLGFEIAPPPAQVDELPPNAMEDWISGDHSSRGASSLLSICRRFSPSDVTSLQLHIARMMKGGRDGTGGGGGCGADAGDWGAGGVGRASWSTLIQQGLPPNAFLGLCMALCAQPSASLSCSACGCLLTAMRLPEASSHGVVHPVAFFHLVKSLRRLLGNKNNNSTDDNNVAKGTKGSRRQKPTKGRRGSKKENRRSRAGEEDEDEGEEDEGEEDTGDCIGPSDRDGLLRELRLLLQTVSLRSHPEPLAQLVDLLAGLGASHGSHATLRLCLREEHGDLEGVLCLVFKALLPALVLAAGVGEGREAIAAQRGAVDFVRRTSGGGAEEIETVGSSALACAWALACSGLGRARVRMRFRLRVRVRVRTVRAGSVGGGSFWVGRAKGRLVKGEQKRKGQWACNAARRRMGKTKRG